MIFFLMCRGFDENVRSIAEDPNAPAVTVLHYDEALTSSSLPDGTYIFLNIDRLGMARLIKAARLFRALRERGCRALNDPTQARCRFPLLRALHRSGFNPFNVYSAEEEERPSRFPVFVRMDYGHDAPLTDLIWNQSDLELALKKLVAEGCPRQGLMIVEYAAEPVRPGLFRKLSVFRVGDQIVPHFSIHDASWVVKLGRSGVPDEVLRAEEVAVVRDNPFGERLRPAFELANIDYGRADFGLLGDQICLYEINMNPVVRPTSVERFPERIEAGRIWWDKFVTALRALESDGEDASRVGGKNQPRPITQ